MKKCNIVLLMLIGICAAHAQDVTLKYVSTSELSDYVIPAGVLVYNIDNPEDLRIGDGNTAGGVRIQNSIALTNVQHNFHQPVFFNGNTLNLNDRCQLATESAVSRFSVDSNIIFSVYGAGSAALGEVVSSYYDQSSTSIVMSVTISGYDTPPDISYKAALTGTWETVTNASYAWPPETDPFDIVIPLPSDTSGYYRVYFPDVITGKVMTVNALFNAARLQAGELLISSPTNPVINARVGAVLSALTVPPITNSHPGTKASLKSDNGTYSYWEAE